MTKVVSIDRRRPDPARMREFAATARKLREERAASDDLVQRLLRERRVEEWASLASDPRLHTSGAVERLNQEVADRLERDPQAALALSEVTTAIAAALRGADYPPVVLAQVQAHAWKCRAQVLFHLGRNLDALRACDRAEELLMPFGTVAHDRAVVRLVRAIVLQYLDRPEESVALIAETRRVFFDHRDLKRCIDAGMAEGVLSYRLRDFVAARAAFLTALDVAKESGNREQIARLHNNLGHCAVDLNDLKSARAHLRHAVALFTELGMHTEALRCELSTAELLAREASLDDTLERLQDVRRKLTLHGMHEEAGFAALDAIQLLVGAGRQSEARALLREIDPRIAYRPRVLAAIDSLGSNPPVRTVEHVRAFLCALRRDPTCVFVPQPA